MTDHDQGAFEAALQADLAAARQQNLVLADQLRQANTLNEGLAYKLDFMHAEVVRVTASREQYERVAIRVSAKMEAATSMVMGQLAELQEEIRAAAFTKPAGTVEMAPARPAEAPEPSYDTPIVGDATTISEFLRFADSASRLPPPRFGNGAVK
jgi:hypothetical protein